MLKELFKTLLSIFSNQVGEFEGGDGGDGQGGYSPADGGQGGSPDAGDQEGEGGQGGEGSPDPAPKYGDFGDEPSVDDVYSHYQNFQQEHETLKGKTAATEKNLASLRKSVEASGMRILTDSDGNVQIVSAEEADKGEPEQESLFTDEHANLFDKPVLDAINLLVQQKVKEALNQYDETRFTDKDKAYTRATTFESKSTEARKTMIELYPQLAKGKERDQSFYDLATSIWQKNYKHMPNGELIAAHEAAHKLSISPAHIMKAKKEGYEQGKSNKKVLGPAGGSQSVKKPGFTKLTKSDYLNLSSEDKDAYDLKALEMSQNG